MRVRPARRLVVNLAIGGLVAAGVACSGDGDGATPSSAVPTGAVTTQSPPGEDTCVPGTIIVTSQTDFDSNCYSAPADEPFTIEFENQDQGIEHNLVIREGQERNLFDGERVTGPATATYEVPAIPAGEYNFFCIVHPLQMSGRFVVG